MIEQRKGSLSAIKDNSAGWFAYVNRPIKELATTGSSSVESDAIKYGSNRLGYTNTRRNQVVQKYPSVPKNLLLESMYSLSEVTKLVHDYFPDENDIVGIVQSWGYTVREPFVFKGVTNPASYFRKVFLESDILASSPYLLRFDNSPVIRTALSSLESGYDIIEFEENQYISIHKLQKFGVDKRCIERFCNNVKRAMFNNRFFTATTIARANLCQEIDSLGFGETFYSSLLKNSVLFEKTYFGKTIIYSFSNRKVSGTDVIEEIVRINHRISLDELILALQNEYGITISRAALLSRIKDTSLYYDSILDYIYQDYESYYADI